MASITQNGFDDYAKNKNIHTSIKAFFREYGIGTVLKKANAYKVTGVPVVDVFYYLVQLVFTNKSMYMNILMNVNPAGFAKDVVYRLLNSPYINWGKYMLLTAVSVIHNIEGLTSEDRLNALAVDDTMFSRHRSKKVELLANVYDHAAKKYTNGFRMLTVAWTDGVSLFPLLFRHLSSPNQKTRRNEAKADIDKRSCGYAARKQAIMSTPEVLFLMLERARKFMVPARHVIFDSWFSYPATIMRIRQIGYHVVGRLKNTSKIKYLVGKDKLTLSQIYNARRKRPGKSKYLLSVEVMLYNDQGDTLPTRLVYVRDRLHSKKWIAFASTDMTLTEEQVIALYGKRWDIEVFFKMCKSYLKLGREFQGLSYDCITAHTAVVLTRYIILAAQKRQNEDPRSLGELFHLCYDELADVQFSDVLATILDYFHESLYECLFLSEAQMNGLLEVFISKLSGAFKHFFVPLAVVG